MEAAGEQGSSASTRMFMLAQKGEGNIEKIAVYLHCPGHGALSMVDKDTGLYWCHVCHNEVLFREVNEISTDSTL